jgi:hypothetical protein
MAPHDLICIAIVEHVPLSFGYNGLPLPSR